MAPPGISIPLLVVMSMMPARAQAIFRGSAPVIRLNRGDEPRVQGLAEDADAFRQDDAVEPILQAVVLAANVELAERILRHFGRLHDDLVEQGVVAARGRRDGGGIDGVGGRAGLGLDVGTALVQVLSGHDDRRQRVRTRPSVQPSVRPPNTQTGKTWLQQRWTLQPEMKIWTSDDSVIAE